MKIAEIKNLSYSYKENCGEAKAVANISFDISAGECLGLIGESGSGKSTIGALLAGFLNNYEGSIRLFDSEKELSEVTKKERYLLYQNVQMVFQDPWQSFPPHMRVGDGIAEGIRYYSRRMNLDKEEIRRRVWQTMEQVGLPKTYEFKKCRELSGGECQRAAIGRAIIRSPKLLICDEVTSALDVSVQAQIMQLLFHLKKEMGMSMLFISHDLALVGGICDQVCVMKDGQILEKLPGGRAMYEKARHPYTQLLMSSVLDIKK